MVHGSRGGAEGERASQEGNWPAATTNSRHDPASTGRNGRANLASCGDVELNPGPVLDRAGRQERAMTAEIMAENCRAMVQQLIDDGTELTVTNISHCIVATCGTYRQRERALRTIPSTIPKGFSRLVRRMNKEIKSARSSHNKRALVELLLTRKSLIREAKRNLSKRQCARNMENFASDPMQEYRKVFKQDNEDVEPQGTIHSAEEYLRREFHPPKGRQPCPEDVVFPDHTPPARDPMPDIAFNASVIIEALEGKKGNASPGLDGVTFGMLKLVPKSVLELLAICFSKILSGEQDIPDSWVMIRVKMLYKGKGKDPNTWDSFRPVCISSCVGKLFNAILGKKLLEHCLDQGLLDTNIQKGFLYNVSGVTDSCQDLLHCLKSIPEDLHILLLDLKSAFNSVPHDKLWALLGHFKVPKAMIDYLKALYKASKMFIKSKSFKSANQSTSPVEVLQGVLQGDTLSPLLFIIYFMLVINAAKHENTGGYKCNPTDNYVHLLKAFADDLNALDNTEDGMRRTWSKIKEGLDWAELRVNIDKCCHLHIKAGSASIQDAKTFRLDENTVVKSGADASAPFLGLDIPLAKRAGKLKVFLALQLQTHLDKITNCKYDWKAKLFFYKVGIISRMRWYFLLYENISESTVNKLQESVMRALKHWSHTAVFAPPEFVTNEERGLACRSLLTLWRQARSVAIAAGLKSDSASVRDAYKHRATHLSPYNKGDIEETRKLVESTVPKAKINARAVEIANIADKERVRRSVNGKEHPAGWIWAIPEDKSLVIWNELLRKRIKEQDRPLFTQIATASSSFWKVVMSSKENCRRSGGNNEHNLRCPRCLMRTTLHHCISGCQHASGKGRMTHRHNSVVLKVFETLTNPEFRPQTRHERAWADLSGAKSIKDMFSDWPDLSAHNIHLTNTSEYDPHRSQSHWLRPDILIERDGGKTLEIIEVACTYEDFNLTSIDRKYAEKESKYEPITRYLVAKGAYLQVNLKVVVIGARGYVPGRFVSDMESLLPDDPHRAAVVHKLAVDCAFASVMGSIRLVRGFLDDNWTPPTLALPERRYTTGAPAPARRFPTAATSTAADGMAADVDPLDIDDGSQFSSVGVGASR
jgi:hypothetical protein